jgi:glutamate racemase
VISLVMGDGVTLVSSADETAKDVYRVLVERDLARDDDAAAPVHQFLTTGEAEPFARLARRFLGADILAGAAPLPGTLVARLAVPSAGVAG